MGGPKVTVLMPVYNGEAYLKGAIESVLAQTFTDFEFLIIDDGSTDRSVESVRSYHDARIRLVRNERNGGLIYTLNRGFDLARGAYIARMDCDDVSLPERLEEQVAFMDTHPDVGVCGTWVMTFGEQREGAVWDYPTDPEVIRCSLLFRAVLAHPSVMIRRDLFELHGLRYDEDYPHAEDFQLWQRASDRFAVANLGEVLLRYRVHAAGVSRKNQEAQEVTLRRIDDEALRRLGIEASPDELALHRALASYRYRTDSIFLVTTEEWLRKLSDANVRMCRYPPVPFERLLGQIWLNTCHLAAKDGARVTRRFLASPLSRHVGLRQRAGFAARSVRWALGVR